MGMTYIQEFKDIDKGKKVNHPVIAISGMSGSGKGLHSKMLQERLKKDYGIKLPICESGQLFRQDAESRGMTPAEHAEYLKNNPKISEELDKTVDRNVLKSALSKPGIYVGRLTTHIIGEHGFKIFLNADPKLIAKRILVDPKREESGRGLTEEQIRKDIEKRDKENTERYGKLYGINYGKDVPAAADVVVKNDRAPDAVFEDIYKPLVRWLKKKNYIKA